MICLKIIINLEYLKKNYKNMFFFIIGVIQEIILLELLGGVDIDFLKKNIFFNIGFLDLLK